MAFAFDMFRSFHLRKLCSLVYLVFLISCENKEGGELICDEYFLAEETYPGDGTTKIYYNTGGLISSLTSQARYGGVSRSEFFYDSDNRLKEVTSSSGSWTEFFQDASGALIATLRYDEGGHRLDSLVVEYDNAGRLSKRSRYELSPLAPYYDSFFTVEYPDEKTVKASFYDRITSSPTEQFEPAGTFTYTIDDKQRPYPSEYYFLYLSLTNVVLSHNALVLEIFRDGEIKGTSTYDFTYNSAGYPMEMKQNGSVVHTYRYVCDALVE